jgi:hypothetical protein
VKSYVTWITGVGAGRSGVKNEKGERLRTPETFPFHFGKPLASAGTLHQKLGAACKKMRAVFIRSLHLAGMID